MWDCLQLQAVKTPCTKISSRFHLLLNYVQEHFVCSIRLPIPSWSYPRSRGENLQFLHHACAMSGSSPLTLGKLEGVHADLPDVRLIPTHAGKTCVRHAGCRYSRAHPHSHGDNSSNSQAFSAFSGSSPLTQGKRHGRHGILWVLGLIPAHAGKTMTAPTVAIHRRAHPHSRGENVSHASDALLIWDSSPLARGKRIHCSSQRHQPGLIPTHAGKTSHNPAHRSASTAHPRSRGENMTQAAPGDLVCGSSPFTRGKRDRARRRARHRRLIPAHAGKTAWLRRA